MTPHESTLRYIDIPLGDGRPVVRLAVFTDDSGETEVLICAGFPHEHGWRRIMAEAVSFPAAALPDLAAALETLAPPSRPRAA